MKLTRFGIYGLIILSLLGCNSRQINLTVNSDPQGAQIKETTLGEIGITNFSKQIDIDQQKYLSFEISKEGYKNARITIDTKASSNVKHSNLADIKASFSKESDLVLHLFLEKYPNQLNVYTKPSNADTQLICNDKKVPFIQTIQTLSFFKDEEQISCTVEASAQGYETVQAPVNIVKNRDNSINLILKRKNIDVSFHSEPQGASVYEKSLGYICTTPCEYTIKGEKLDAIAPNRDAYKRANASLQFEFLKEGFKNYATSLSLEKSKTSTIDVKLTKEN